MTKAGLTEIVTIVDRSGSMGHLRSDVIGGFNNFLAEQQKLPGEARMTYVQFDNEYEQLFSSVPVKSVAPLSFETYVPRGGTALLDAVGRTINEVGARLRSTPESERPERVIVVIQTDGEENSSREFTYAQINDMVTHQREKYNWEFIFLGANIDSFAVGSAIGLAACNIANFAGDQKGVLRSYGIVSQAVASYRGTGCTLDANTNSIGDYVPEEEPTSLNIVSQGS